MCNLKSEGGKRCAVHMSGSRAVIKAAEVDTKLDRGFLSKMFNMLRREGKNLPNPSQEEVTSFADEQRIRARFDSSLSNRDRNTLMRNWKKAREEQPDGKTFHAWKNLRSTAAAQKLRRGMAALSIFSVASVSAACGIQPDPQPEPPSPSPTATEEVTETPPTPTPVDGISWELPDGFSTGEPVSSQHGEYLPIQLDEDSPLLKYDESVVDDIALQHYSPDEIEEAQGVAATFVVNEGIDSALVYDYSEENAQEWWDNNKDSFNPSQQEAFYDSLMDDQNRNAVIDNNAGDMFRGGSQGEGSWTRGFPIYEPGTQRTGNVSMDLTNVTTNSTGDYLYFTFEGETSRQVYDPRVEDQKTPLIENTDYEFSVLYMPMNNGWKLSGTDNKFNTYAAE